MKNSFSQGFVLKSLMIVLMMIGFSSISSVSTLQAQSGGATLTQYDDIPNGPYLAPQDAINRIEALIAQIKPQLENLTPSTTEHRNLSARVEFFALIQSHLMQGKTVPQGIGSGLVWLSTDTNSKLTKSKRQELKEEAIALLAI